MIYVGFIRFNNTSDRTHELNSILKSYTNTNPTIIKKNSLTLCYGKLPKTHDMDDVWKNDSSIFMGRIFDKVKGISLKKQDFKTISYVNTEETLTKFWGKYVYINVIDGNKEKDQLEIVVDPTGQLPFFYYPFADGNVLFSSDIEIIFKALGQKPRYNWGYLCSYLVYGNSSAIQTPFENIYELPPACSLKITKDEKKTKPLWNPLASYKASVFQKKDAVDILKTSLKSWIEPYKNICVSLSGGLDSSSLVFCLNEVKKKDQSLSALNYFHSLIRSSDELIYARKVAKETGIDLIEVDASHTLPFDPYHKKQCLNPNKPFPGLISLKWLENISDHIPFVGPCAFLSGHGSDHIFMRPPSKKSVSDYAIEKGLKGSKEKLNNITHFYRDSLISVLKENTLSLGAYFFSKRQEKRNFKNAQNKIVEWMREGVQKEISLDFIHPIYKHLPLSVLPGKYEQIDDLYRGLASIQVEKDLLNPTVYPFLFEPVVEFALSFPTYDLYDKGYDRYPLRKAISDHFKTDTVWRRDKSQTTGIFQLGVKKNLKHVLELCLEGQFAKQGLIDKERLHKTIMMISNGDNKYMRPSMHLASIEIFLNFWEEKFL